jgi:hypothetical protein
MEIKTNMARYIEQADLCSTCVSGPMMYDKCRNGSQGGVIPRLATHGQGTALCKLWLILNMMIKNMSLTRQ